MTPKRQKDVVSEKAKSSTLEIFLFVRKLKMNAMTMNAAISQPTATINID
jgi:hypothetical protein